LPSVLGSAFIVVFIHWIVTDFGVWMGSTVYAQTFMGFITCLITAIPFELNLLAGTLLYSIILFGCFQWMQGKYPVLQQDRAVTR
jgi:hypothetical protein